MTTTHNVQAIFHYVIIWMTRNTEKERPFTSLGSLRVGYEESDTLRFSESDNSSNAPIYVFLIH